MDINYLLGLIEKHFLLAWSSCNLILVVFFKIQKFYLFIFSKVTICHFESSPKRNHWCQCQFPGCVSWFYYSYAECFHGGKLGEEFMGSLYYFLQLQVNLSSSQNRKLKKTPLNGSPSSLRIFSMVMARRNLGFMDSPWETCVICTFFVDEPRREYCCLAVVFAAFFFSGNSRVNTPLI